ncbi:YncE family protein [Bradyrhizobium oligotrophicum]|uniref:YncE family protein n=1 Tax=Bradyrhizobium oligotrophicum TaxID=44255 RepID=UPI003EC00D22
MMPRTPRPVRAAPILAALASLPLVWLAAFGSVRAEEPETAERPPAGITVPGLHVGFSLSATSSNRPPAAGREATFTFSLATGASESPLRGARPAAWLVPHAPGSSLDERQCRRLAANLVSGASLAMPALDLNTFYVLSLGGDATVSVIDPRIGFGGSRLIGLASLQSAGSDWVLTSDQSVLAVAQPSAGRIALIDTRDWSIAASIDLPGAERLMLTPDGRLLIASYRAISGGVETGGGLALIDPARPETPPVRIETGSGAHDIAVDVDGHFAFVSHANADSVSVIDLATARLVRTVPAGHRPVALAYSVLARRAYVAAEDGRITALDSASPRPLASIAGPAGMTSLRFAPGGRFLVATSPDAGEVVVVDSATDRIVQRIALDGQPMTAGFSDRFMYVARRASEFVDAFPLDQIGTEGRTPNAMSIGIGQLALGAVSVPSRADIMAQAPGGASMVIASPGERTIYYYREGMAAPAGSLSTYGREPRAVKMLDRRLQEVEPGVYRTTAQLPRAGDYDVVFYTDSPRTVQCFVTRIARDATGGSETVRTPVVTDLVLSSPPRAGQPLALQFHLVDPDTGAPVDTVQDASIVSFAIPGRDAARSPARPLGDGSYQADLSVPAAGTYYVFVEAPSVALAPIKGRLLSVESEDRR